MTLQDLFVTPIYFFILTLLAFVIRPMVTTRQTRKYYFPALFLKFFGAIVIGLIFKFYYGWGDTYSFYRDASRIWYVFQNNPEDALRLIFSPLSRESDLYKYWIKFYFYQDSASYMVARIAAFIGLFTFNTYSSTALFFAFFSFSGSWAFFSSIVKIFPYQIKQLAIAILFIPSVIIWGSGIFKDTLTFGALMWIVWAFAEIIEFKKWSLIKLFLIGIMIVLINAIKPYILLTLLPALILWILLKNLANIRNIVLRILIFPLMLLIAVSLAYFSATYAGESDRRYKLENLPETSKVTAYDIRYVTGAEAGSGYSLGELDGTWQNMLLLSPAAVNVAIYRPYFWEVSNPLMFLSALESFWIFLLTLQLGYRARRNWNIVRKNPMMISFLVFALVFAFAVGISSFNFGTLVRYKIPLMPFLAILLLILPKINSRNRINK